MTRRYRWASSLIMVLLPLLLPLSGCIDAKIVGQLLPDGSGFIDVDLGYDTSLWPTFLGDPLASFEHRDQLRNFISPGLLAWSKPRRSNDGPWKRLRAKVYFQDVNQVQFVGTDHGRPVEALGFSYDRTHRRLRMRPGFVRWLDAPLPLPTPQDVGLELSLSPQLLEGIKSQIRPVIEGFSCRLDLRLPGPVTRADGLRSLEGPVASLTIDDDLLARAFTERAGLLFDEEALRGPDPQIDWQTEVDDPHARELFESGYRAALQWWEGDQP